MAFAGYDIYIRIKCARDAGLASCGDRLCHVIARSHHGDDIAGARINGNKCRIGGFDELVIALRSLTHYFLRLFLQFPIKRRDHFEPPALHKILAVFFVQIVADMLDEVRRADRFMRQGKRKRLGLGLVRFLARYKICFRHAIQHPVFALEQIVFVGSVRGIIAWSAGERRDGRGLGKREIRRLFGKIHIRRGRDAVGIGSVGDLIEIKSENLIFAILPLKQERQYLFAYFALDGFLGSQD